MSKVSIITISFNRPLFLLEAIQSIQDQTHQDWEMIITDDCSPCQEEIRNILTRVSSEDNRIRPIFNSVELHYPTRVWNRMIAEAKGDYICILDDDNRKYPTFMERLVKILDDNPDYDAATCYSIMDDGVSPRLHNRSSGASYDTMRNHNHIDTGEVLYRKSVFDRLGGFDESLNACEDWDFLLKMFACGFRFGNTQEPLTWYRIHNTQRLKTLDIGLQHNAENQIRSKTYVWPIKVAIISPPNDRMTFSQRQVCAGFKDAIANHQWLVDSSNDLKAADIRLLLGPFLWDPLEVQAFMPFSSVHMEDPAGFPGSIRIAPFADRIFTNDIAVVDSYDAEKTTVVPCLSFNDVAGFEIKNHIDHYDIGLTGYAYPSRKIFVENLITSNPSLTFLLIGDGWDSNNNPMVTVFPTIAESETLSLLSTCRMIVCYHRQLSDVNGTHQLQPRSLHRGYMESACGRPVLIDGSREQHSFEGEAIFYSDVEELNETINAIIHEPNKYSDLGLRARQRAAKDFTYRIRLGRIIGNLIANKKGGVIA